MEDISKPEIIVNSTMQQFKEAIQDPHEDLKSRNNQIAMFTDSN